MPVPVPVPNPVPNPAPRCRCHHRRRQVFSSSSAYLAEARRIPIPSFLPPTPFQSCLYFHFACIFFFFRGRRRTRGTMHGARNPWPMASGPRPANPRHSPLCTPTRLHAPTHPPSLYTCCSLHSHSQILFNFLRRLIPTALAANTAPKTPLWLSLSLSVLRESLFYRVKIQLAISLYLIKLQSKYRNRN